MAAPAKGKGLKPLPRGPLDPHKVPSAAVHSQFVERLWNRVGRNRHVSKACQKVRHEVDVVTPEELCCDEFQEVLRSILAPNAKKLGGQGRSEMDLQQLLTYFIKLADLDADGVLIYEEFERFMALLRNRQDPKFITNVTYALFDLDHDGHLDLSEFREVYRYQLGHDPLCSDLMREWEILTISGSDRVTKETYCKWLSETRNPAFTQHAKPIKPRKKKARAQSQGAPPEKAASAPATPAASKPASPAASKAAKTTPGPWRPCPGMLTRPKKIYDPEAQVPEWNQRFACKDPSEMNLAMGGNIRAKQLFMRNQSLPELQRFYETYSGFESNRRRLGTGETEFTQPKPKLVLSTDSVMLHNMPGRERHLPGGIFKDANGELVPWREETPRALKPIVWEPATLLLRLPFSPLKTGPRSEAYPPKDFEHGPPKATGRAAML